ENNLKLDLFKEHNGYDIIEMIHDDLHPRKPVGHVDSDSDSETNVPLDDVSHYMQNDRNKLLALCGRDINEGKCVGLKGKKPKRVNDDECETSKQGSKKGDDHSSKLWQYRQAILDINLGFTYILEAEVNDEDGKLYFNRDANNSMFPIACAIVGVENNVNWSWFLSMVRDDLNLGGRGIYIISYGHNIYWSPNAKHKPCARHIYANLKKRWNGLQLKRLFLGAVAISMESVFLQKMKEIKMLNEKAHEWLVERNHDSWCRAYFVMYRCSATFENGISKSFNSRIVGDRGKPIISMLEDIRVYIMQRIFCMNKLAFDNKDLIKPSVRRQMKYNKSIQSYREVKVRKGDQAFGVNLHQMKCVYSMWQLSGIPCVYAWLGGPSSSMQPPTSTPSTSNTMLPLSGSNTMPPPLTLSGLNIMPSYATPILNTSVGKTAKSNASSNRGGSRDGVISRDGLRVVKLVEVVLEVVLGVILRVVQEKRAQDKGMPEDVATGKEPITEDVAVGKQPMIKDEPLQSGANLPPQVSIIKVNLKPTRSKKSKPTEVPNQMRIFHKNKGRSERIFNQKMKNYKFDEHGTGSTPDKAFDVE
nr:hypothetical protein CTI12_AA091940 [Tanacetum cinerariifolium]